MKLTKHQINILHAVSIPVLILVSFYGGMSYARTNTTKQFELGNRNGMMQAGAGTYGGRTGGRNGAMSSGFASGEVLSKDDKSLTIKLRNGGSQIILLSDKTQVVKSDQGVITDVIVGGNVTINGTANQDGSVTAESIQIRPGAPTTPSTTKTN